MENDIHSYEEQVEEILAKKRAQHRSTGVSGRSAVVGILRGRETLDHCISCGREIVWLRGAPNPICTDCNRTRSWSKDYEERARLRLERAGLLEGEPAHMHLATFERHTKAQKRAYEVVAQWLADWSAQMQLAPYEGFRDSVLLWSVAPGTGKTHLARAVQREVIMGGGIRPKGDVAAFEPVSQLINELRGSYDDPEKSSYKIMERLMRSDLLILDDLGKEYISATSRAWFQDILWNIIDNRYTQMRPLFVTSNLEPAGVCDLMGVYAASRFNEMVQGRICDMTGADWRMRG